MSPGRPAGNAGAGSEPGGAAAGGATPDRYVQATAARPRAGLERDPCPGDVADVRAMASRLRGLAGTLGTGAAAAAGWQAVAWHDAVAHLVALHVGRVVEVARRLRVSLDLAADALDGWASALADLQAEADALDREAVELLRRRDEHVVTARALATDPVAGLDLGGVLRQQQVEADLRRVHERALQLHGRYVATARTHASVLDAAAPRGGAPAGAWRSGWDRVHDDVSLAVRDHAPLLELHARVTGTASTVAGMAALVPHLAPVAGPVSLALAGGSVAGRAVLRAGADGSTEALGSAVTAAALSGVSLAGPAVRSVDPVTGAFRAVDVGTTVGVGATGAGTGLELSSWLPGEHTGGTRTGSVDLGGGRRTEVTAHDEAESWHTGSGTLRPGTADHYAGVAVVPVPLGVLSGAATPARRAASDERDHEHRVRRGGG